MNDLLQSLKLSILHVGYAKLDHGWSYRDVISPFARLFYVTTGAAVMNHTNQVFNLKPGYMYLVPSYVYNSYNCEVFHEQFYLSFFEEIEPGLSITNLKHFIFEVKACPSDVHYFKRLIEINPDLEIKNNAPKPQIKRNLTTKVKRNKNSFSPSYYVETQGIMAVLLSRFVENKNIDPLEGSDYRDLNRVLIYIAKNLHNTLTVENLAQYCGFSTDHFSRSFKNKFGIRPANYIQSRRIARAQFLLLSTQDSLKQIAENSGFKNASYFSRTFKKITGNTPACFRKTHFNM